MSGLYGVIAYTAAQRRRDIGIRLALGVPRSGVILEVVGPTGWLVAFGLGLGVAACVPLSRWVDGLVFGVTTRDALTYGLAGAVLAVAGLLPRGCRRGARHARIQRVPFDPRDRTRPASAVSAQQRA